MLNFDFLEKSLGMVSPTHFVYKKNCFSYVHLDVINFEINLIFLIKPFLNMAENLRQKFKYLEN